MRRSHVQWPAASYNSIVPSSRATATYEPSRVGAMATMAVGAQSTNRARCSVSAFCFKATIYFTERVRLRVSHRGGTSWPLSVLGGEQGATGILQYTRN
eukprot:1195636-Prorocentrum_minimum.AAC.6